MNSFKNKVQLMGFLGADPEVKVFDSGKKKVQLSLATHESFKNSKGEKVSQTTWHQLVAWGSTAEIAERYLNKGAEIMVEGSISYRDYTDKQGTTHHITEINVNELLILSTKVPSVVGE